MHWEIYPSAGGIFQLFRRYCQDIPAYRQAHQAMTGHILQEKPMKHTLAAMLLALFPLIVQAAPEANDSGLISHASPYPVAETLDRLEAVLRGKGVKVFARIDHSAEAQGMGLNLNPSQLLIFGHPKAGTPLMRAAPSIGLDLPMKALAWQDERGQVHVTWSSPEFLIRRHGLEAAYVKNLAAVGGLIEAALK